MSNLRFRCLVDNDFCDIAPFEPYIEKGSSDMGLDRDYEKYDIGRLVKTPIWAAHSSDDTNVKIDSDDYYAAHLKKLGADIKYTRWDKYGHTMSGKFYRTEKWAEWCLSKKLR